MTGDTVQTWDNVADLPWREAFDMSCPPERDVDAAPTPVRALVDARCLADVVRAMVAA